MFALIGKVLRDLSRRRIRSALTVLGIAVGVGGLVAITSTARNVVRAQRELFHAVSQADITYWVWEAPARLAVTLQAHPLVAAVELRLVHVTRWRASGSWMDMELVGIEDFGRVRVNRFDLLRGRYPLDGEILLDLSASRAVGVEVGDEIACRDPSGRERTLVVSGISASPSYLSSTITRVAVGYVPAAFLRRLVGVSGSNQLLIKLHDLRDAQAVVRYVDRLLRQQGLQAGRPAIRRADEFPGKRELDALIVVMFLFSALGLALSSLLVINTLSASVAEQIGEIAILKAIGATRRQVLLLYLLEALAYGLLGTPLGIAVGAIGGWRLLVWIGSLANATVRFRLALEGVLLGVGIGLGVSVLAGLAPALQGMRVSVREALESYGIRSDYGQGRLTRLLQCLRLPPLMAMALRNPSRRRTRTLLTLLVVALSAAAFVGATATKESVDSAIADIYTTYHADAWAWLDRSVSAQFEKSFLAVEGVYAAEGWVIADGVVKLAAARLWGLPPESGLYRQVMQEGRWFRPNELNAVVLSAELAKDQRIRVGERVEIQAHGRSRTFTVVGIAIDNTIFLGGTLAGKAFMPRTSLANLLGQEERVNLFALGLAGRERQTADEILAKVERKFRAYRPGVQPVYAEIESAREASRLLTLALAAMVLIVALVGALGILNTFTLNITERRREIAVMRAIGATDAALLFSFLTEGLALGGLGWLFGLALGYPIGRLFTAQLSRVLFTLPFVLSARAVLASAVFALGLAALSSLGPACSAARMPAVAGLRYE